MGFRDWLHGTWLWDDGVTPGVHGNRTPSHRVGTLPPVSQSQVPALTREDVRAILREELPAELRKAARTRGTYRIS